MGKPHQGKGFLLYCARDSIFSGCYKTFAFSFMDNIQYLALSQMFLIYGHPEKYCLNNVFT
jgi:hypothetical protein